MVGDSSVAELILKIVADSSGVKKELNSLVEAEKEVAKGTEEVNSKIASTSVGFSKSVKQMTQPLMQFRSAMMRIGMIVGLVFGATLGAAKAVSKEFSELDSIAIGLGRTVEEISVKKYGFNIDTENLRLAADTADVVTSKLGALWEATKLVGASTVGFTAQLLRFGETWGVDNFTEAGKVWKEAGKSMAADMKEAATAVKSVSTETLQQTENLLNRTKQLTMNDVQFKMDQMDIELKRYIAKKGEKKVADDYEAAYIKRLTEDRAIEYLRMQAQLARADGDHLRALDMEQQAELMLYRRKDNAMVESKKAAMAKIKQIEELHASGLKTLNESISGSNAEMGMSLTDSLGGFFKDAWRGELKSVEEYFADFGTKILDSWSNTLAEMVANLIFSKTMMKTVLEAPMNFIGGLFGSLGAVMHTGGVVGGYIQRAHSGLSAGEIPIIAQAGEGVLSRNGMASLGSPENLSRLNAGEKLGGSGPIIINMAVQAWDSRDIIRNQKTLAAGIGEEMRKNGDIRKIMREYA